MIVTHSATLTVTERAAKASGGSGSSGGGSPPPAGSPGPLGAAAAEGRPQARLASSSSKVSRTGAFQLKVGCAAGSTCVGVLTVSTLTAVSVRVHAARRSILTLASAAFNAAGGQTSALTLHLSARGKALLKRSRTLRTRTTVRAHNLGGTAFTSSMVLTLRLARG